jgi:hypothetical protein
MDTSRSSPTPVSLLEEFFEVTLTSQWVRAMRRGVQPQRWIEFAKFYRERMKAGFAESFLQPDDAAVRVYFEPRLAHSWETAVSRKFASTPLLGLRPYLDAPIEDEAGVSAALAPLKKHLLFANSVYIRDSFYYCFDGVADFVEPERWQGDPNVRRLVERSIEGINAWLMMLLMLRPLIDSRALVFMPYYLTPSFPYDGNAPALEKEYARLFIPPDPRLKMPGEATFDLGDWSKPPVLPERTSTPDEEPAFETDEATAAWLNARLLGLAPVFPTRTMFDWARGLHFRDEGGADIVTNLVSIQWLPFGHKDGLSVDDLSGLRANEEVFAHVRQAILKCLAYAEANVTPATEPQVVADACKSLLRDELERYERNSVLRILEEHPVAAAAFAIAMGAAFLSASAAVSVIVPAVLTPQVARIVQKQFDPRRRAYRHLQSLL